MSGFSQTSMEQISPASRPSLQQLLRWHAPARVVQERGKTWYLIGGGCVVGAAAYGIITGSWALAIVAVLCGAVYVLLRGHVPEPRDIAITEQGIFFDGQFTSFADLKSFWFIATPLATELHIARKSRGGPFTILTGDTDPFLIRETLGRFLPEDSDKRENVLDLFIRICKL